MAYFEVHSYQGPAWSRGRATCALEDLRAAATTFGSSWSELHAGASATIVTHNYCGEP